MPHTFFELFIVVFVVAIGAVEVFLISWVWNNIILKNKSSNFKINDELLLSNKLFLIFVCGGLGGCTLKLFGVVF